MVGRQVLVRHRLFVGDSVRGEALLPNAALGAGLASRPSTETVGSPESLRIRNTNVVTIQTVNNARSTFLIIYALFII